MGTPVRNVQETNESSGDTCGFILHVLIVLVAIASCVSFLLPPLSVAFDKDSYAKQVWDLFPDRSVGALVVRLLLGALVATPLVYFVVNSLSVPAFDSINTLCDESTRAEVDTKEIDMNCSTPR